MKRRGIIWLAVGAMGALGIILCLWLFLSSWVPTRGKALFIQYVKQHSPYDLTMDDVRAELFQGIVLKNVKISHRPTQELWVDAPTMHVHVSWWSLLLRHRFAFRADATLTVPAQTEVTVTGTVNVRTSALSLDVRTTTMELRDITPPLRPHVPPSLTDGTVRLALHIAQAPPQPPTISGRIMGTRLTWMSSPVHLQADLILSGQVTAPRHTGGPWEIQSLLTLHNGTAEGLPTLHTISQLEGTAQLTQHQLEIEELTGSLVGTRWTLEGTVAPLDRPSLEVLLSSHVDIAKLSSNLNPWQEHWQPAGQAKVRAVCRGPLSMPYDCLVHAELQNDTLTGSTLVSPITHINGQVDYDAFTHRLSITQLEGRVQDETLSTRGEVTLAPVVNVSIDVRGTVPLDFVHGWLPPDSPVSRASGLAVTDLHLQGPIAQLEHLGQVELQEAGVEIKNFAHPIDHINGVVYLTREDLHTEHLSLVVDRQPITLTATLSPGAVPKILATITIGQGEVSIASRLTPKDLIIDEGHLSLAQSRVQLTGRYGRTKDRSSTLHVKGAVDLAALSHVPFVPWPALEAWKMQGLATVDAQWQGRWSDWPGALIRGHLHADHLSVRDIPLDRVVCELEQRNRTLRLRIPSAFVASGKLVGELTIEHHAQTRNYLLQTDITGLQLAKLTEVIPVWRTRLVTGIASGHALLSGTWETRSTWHGDGWLNVSGERLADIPLFDRLFRGGILEPLADWLGLEPLRRAEITQVSLRWQLAQERFRTEDLRLAGVATNAGVVIYGHGSVGLDQTIDLTVEPVLSEQIIDQARVLSSAASILKSAGLIERFLQLVRYHITGTLKEPKSRFQFTPQEVLKQVVGSSAGELLHNLFGPWH